MQAAPVEHGTGTGLPPSGVSWPDVFLRLLSNVNVAQVLLVLAALALLLAALLAWRTYRQAVKSHRSWRFLWGFLDLGAPPTAPASDHATPGAKPSPPALPLSPQTRLASQLIEIIPDLARANGEAREKAEGLLLHLLREATQHPPGVERRVAILRAEPRGNDTAMVLQRGYPETAFGKPAAAFLLSVYSEKQQGLCWRFALEAAQTGGHGNVRAVTDLDNERAFAPGDTTRRPKSILVGPIVSDAPLGAICLDTRGRIEFDERDKEAMALASLALKVAWKLRGT